MPVGGRGARFAGVRFTSQQAQFLQAGIRAGMGVRQLRTIFREQFDRGLPSESFTAARRLLSEGEIAGIALQRLGEGRRLSLARIPRVIVIAPRSRFLLTGKVRSRIPRTGAIVERIIRFGSDEIPSLNEFRRRAQDIIDKGVAAVESAMIFEEIEGVSVVEMIAE